MFSKVAAAASLSLLLAAGAADAAVAQACVGPEVEVDAETTAALPELGTKVRAHLADVGADKCASVRVVAASGKMLVIVSLKDGRSALRRVKTVEELLDAVDALVLVPAPAVATVSDEPSAPAVVFVPPPNEKDAVPAPAATEVARPHFELGLAGTASVLGAPMLVGFGLQGFAQVSYAPYLIGVTVQYDPLVAALGEQARRERFETSTVGVAAVAGRRFEVASFRLDLLGAFAMVGQHQRARPTEAPRVEMTSIGPRVGLSGRLSDGGRSGLRGYLGVDVSAWWPKHDDALPDGLRQFASFSTVLSLGLVWGPA